jgi:hypothetical protein
MTAECMMRLTECTYRMTAEWMIGLTECADDS